MYGATHFGLNGLLAVHIYHFNAVLTVHSHQSAKIRWWCSARLLLESLQISLECRPIDSYFTCWREFNGTSARGRSKNRLVWAVKGGSGAIQSKLILGATDNDESMIVYAQSSAYLVEFNFTVCSLLRVKVRLCCFRSVELVDSIR